VNSHHTVVALRSAHKERAARLLRRALPFCFYLQQQIFALLRSNLPQLPCWLSLLRSACALCQNNPSTDIPAIEMLHDGEEYDTLPLTSGFVQISPFYLPSLCGKFGLRDWIQL
jgi:hypothetical protein